MHPTLAALTLVLACTLPACASETVGPDLQGIASVIDGDTIRVDGLDASMRLLGLDTEETFKRKSEWRDFDNRFRLANSYNLFEVGDKSVLEETIVIKNLTTDIDRCTLLVGFE